MPDEPSRHVYQLTLNVNLTCTSRSHRFQCEQSLNPFWFVSWCTISRVIEVDGSESFSSFCFYTAHLVEQMTVDGLFGGFCLAYTE